MSFEKANDRKISFTLTLKKNKRQWVYLKKNQKPTNHSPMLKSKFDIEKNHQATYSQLAVIDSKKIPQRKKK